MVKRWLRVWSIKMLVDTHCHLDFQQFNQDREAVVQRAIDSGVTRIIVTALDINNCSEVLALTQTYPTVYAAVGIHPNSCANWKDDLVDRIRKFAEHPRVVAIGEIGLDYYRERSPPSIQRRALKAQLKLALWMGI